MLYNIGEEVKKMSNGKVEDMLSQLIKMVGTIQVELHEVKQDVQGVKQELQEVKQGQQEMQSKIQEIETKSENRHKEILERFKDLETDQDFIWEKTARNEREIANLKSRFS